MGLDGIIQSKEELRMLSHEIKNHLGKLTLIVTLSIDENSKELALAEIASIEAILQSFLSGYQGRERFALAEIIDRFNGEFELEGGVIAEIEIFSNKAGVYEIFNNLITNNKKYNPNEKITINLEMNDEVMEITFISKGLPIENEDSIFNFGYRGSESKGTPGEGIGLHLSQKIARLLQGDLIYQYQNNNIQFILTLPLNANSI